MSVWDVFKYFGIGIGLNIVLGFLLRLLGGEILQTIYWPWLMAGEWLFPSGPGGHAIPGGAMLGMLVGFLVYSMLLGIAVRAYKMWRMGSV